MVSVPPEITDRIIDFLHNDDPALLNCSLVCKQWTPSSRYHLFHTVQASGLNGQRKLASMLESTPQLGQYVRVVYIMIRYDVTTTSICQKLANLTDLQLINCDICDIGAFANLLAMFPALTHLGLRDCSFSTANPGNIGSDVALPKGIESLDLSQIQFNLPEFMDWAIGVDLFRRVRTFRYAHQDPEETEDIPGLCTFLKSYGTNLRTVSLFNLPVDYSNDVLNAFTGLNALEHLTISLMFIDRDRNDMGIWPLNKVPTLFNQISSTFLAEVTFDLQLYGGPRGTYEEFDERFSGIWRDTAHALARFTALSKFVLKVDPFPLIQSTSTWFDPLKALKERGILQLSGLRSF